MCGTFYKYFLITSTSFMASSGLYFMSLTRWLWMSPIEDSSGMLGSDWRTVPQGLGAICLVLFSLGLLIVVRGRIRELFLFVLLVTVVCCTIAVILLLQLTTKEVIFDLSDTFLLVVVCLMLSIIANLLLFIRHIRSRMRKEHSANSDDLSEVDL